MGTGNGTLSTRQLTIQAALRELRSDSYIWHRGLTIGKIAARVGLSEETIYNLFGSKDVLIGELIDAALIPSELDTDDTWNTDIFLDQLSSVSDDQPFDLAEAVGQLVEHGLALQVADPSLRSHMLLWSQVDTDPRIRAGVAESYRRWDLAIAGVIRAYFEEARLYGGRQRVGFEANELAVVLGALLEGLAVRVKVYGDQLPPLLARKTVLCFLSSLVAFDDDQEPVGDLSAVAERRQRWLEARSAS